MINLYYRVINAFKVFFWALRNPKALHAANFEMVSGLLTQILKTSHTRDNYLSHIAIVHPDISSADGEIVTIWTGAGLGADPLKRLSKLREENNELKKQVSQLLQNADALKSEGKTI
jgi:hypothetical protein